MKLKSLSDLGRFDSLYHLVCNCFSKQSDSRKANNSYSLLDLLKSGFAMFSLKSPSLLNFINLTQSEENNLSSIYKLAGLPSENGLRQGLDQVNLTELGKIFRVLWERLRKLGILDTYRYWRKHFIVSIDGVEHFSSKKIHCPHCLSRTHNGVTSYYHSMLSAVLVHPEQREVFVMANEPIIRQDGVDKNDCERNAFKRLIQVMTDLYGKQKLLFVMDALYSCGPVMKAILANKRWQCVIGIKPDGNKSLFTHFEARDKRGDVSWYEKQEEAGLHRYGYTNNLPLNATHPDLRVNVIYYEYLPKKGKKRTFTWVTSIRLTQANVVKLAQAGRARWKIENETFNTLKNQGYHFEHNYGHGKDKLCSVFAILMMMAFTVDQIQQHACTHFRKLWLGLKTKKKLWENIRAAFKMIDFQSMEQLFEHLAKINRIKLE